MRLSDEAVMGVPPTAPMSAESDAVDWSAPLSSLLLDEREQVSGVGVPVVPVVLQGAVAGPEVSAVVGRFDPGSQVCVGADGLAVAPRLAKDWTTLPGTHTDGDGGDNELWGWEESG